LEPLPAEGAGEKKNEILMNQLNREPGVSALRQAKPFPERNRTWAQVKQTLGRERTTKSFMPQAKKEIWGGKESRGQNEWKEEADILRGDAPGRPACPLGRDTKVQGSRKRVRKRSHSTSTGHQSGRAERMRKGLIFACEGGRS